MADDEGIYFDNQINNRLRDVSRMASLEIILERATKSYTEEEKVALATKKNNIHVKLLDNLTEANASEDVKYTLQTLKDRGNKVAVGSSSKNTMKILTNTGLLKYFNEIANGTMITKPKPDSEAFLLAAKKLNLDPSECMVIEDAKAGIEAGHNGGFETCDIGDEVEDFDLADHKIVKLSDLLQYV